MATTVEEGFRDFHGRLTPTETETAKAASHRASIEACLKSNFEITRFFRAGSFGNGTSIRGHSDVDYFASIPQKHLASNSYSTLTKVWRVLDARFPNTQVGIRDPVVMVPFGQGISESHDIVPAHYVDKTSEGHLIYEISDRDGGWMKTSPDAHNAYVASVNDLHGGKVKKLIRFIKAWNYYRNVPLYSFYLEMQVARYASKEQSIVYSIDVYQILKMLSDNGFALMQDPVGISGYIRPCFSEEKKQDALSKLATALTRAAKAREAEQSGDIKGAFGWWDLVFDGKFPAYG